jgi:putative glutamine amidotransferase
MARVRVGITAYRDRATFGAWTADCALIPCGYVESICLAGGCPIVIPTLDATWVPDVLGGIDALVLSGGPDIDPVHYGAQAVPEAGRCDTTRDVWELALLAGALARDLPVLGICRGMQLLNVHAGGSLVQHLADAVLATHRAAPGSFACHAVYVAPDSRPSLAVAGSGDVSSHHHQAVDRPGHNVRVVARAEDGTVEAIDLEGYRFAVGVQWHPEVRREPSVFQALVDAAKARRTSGLRPCGTEIANI